jgi:Flp pilus assembly protein TadB
MIGLLIIILIAVIVLWFIASAVFGWIAIIMIALGIRRVRRNESKNRRKRA